MPLDRGRLLLAGLGATALFCRSARAEAPPAEGPDPLPDEAEARATAPVPERHVRTFAEAAGTPRDHVLEGVDAAAEVVVSVPEAWELVSDPVLRVQFDHSSALRPDRSHLTVVVNDHPVGSIALDGSNGIGGELVVAVPREVLQPWNHVVLRASQRVGGACEDPLDPSLWTRVRATSTLEMEYLPRPVVPDLGRLPFPLFDETGVGPARLALGLAAAPSPATVAAVGRIGLAFGRLAAYRRVDAAEPITDLAHARTHVVVVGLPDENPLVRQLLPTLTLAPSEGWVAMRPNPNDPALAVLVVTGADAEGLARAAAAVAGRERREVLSGTDVRVTAARDAAPPAHRQLPRPAPPDDVFRFTDLGVDDRTVRGFHTPAVRVPLGLEGDAVVRPGRGAMTLDYGYAAGLDGRLSAMEVRVDGITVATVPLDDPAGASRAHARIELPDTVLRPDAVVDVLFHLTPRDFDTCRYASDRALWATVYASSRFELPRDRVAELPDLSRLAVGGWPYTLEPSRGDTAIVLPDAPSPSDVTAGFELSAMLGRVTAADAPAFRMIPSAGHTLDALRDAHLLLVATDTPHGLRDRLRDEGRLRLDPGGGRSLRASDRAALIEAQGDGALGAVEQLLHPGDPDRSVLVLHAPTAALLGAVVDTLTDPVRVSELDGSVAVLAADGETRTLTLAERRQVGRYAVGAAVQGLVRRHWLLLGAAVVVGGFGFAAVRRAWARARNGE
jgi:hypothetical protein